MIFVEFTVLLNREADAPRLVTASSNCPLVIVEQGGKQPTLCLSEVMSHGRLRDIKQFCQFDAGGCPRRFEITAFEGRYQDFSLTVS